jgi:hypothetical protein
LKMGLIGSPETSTERYYSMLSNISEEWRSHMMIGKCSPRFGITGSCSARSSLVWSVLAWSDLELHMQILDDLLLTAKFKDRTSSFTQVNMVLPLHQPLW